MTSVKGLRGDTCADLVVTLDTRCRLARIHGNILQQYMEEDKANTNHCFPFLSLQALTVIHTSALRLADKCVSTQQTFQWLVGSFKNVLQ